MHRYILRTCRQALHRVPDGEKGETLSRFRYDLNVYRGCEHGCQYCFAQYSHNYLEDSAYFRHIYVKQNVAERLDADLSSGRWDGSTINLGGVTDSYQPCEARFCLMPDVWRVLIRHRAPVAISTKSALLLRDMAYVEELAACARVHVACTVTSLDGAVASKLEPGASPPAERLAEPV